MTDLLQERRPERGLCIDATPGENGLQLLPRYLVPVPYGAQQLLWGIFTYDVLTPQNVRKIRGS